MGTAAAGVTQFKAFQGAAGNRRILASMLVPFCDVSTFTVRPMVARHLPDGEFGWGGISVKL